MGWLLLPVVLYAGLILYYSYYFYRKKPYVNYQDLPQTLPAVSVVIPLRNEAQHIYPLIQNLSRQEYPADKVEFIWVNDHSTDDTWKILQTALKEQSFPFSHQLINLGPGKYGKREAMTEGIHLSSNHIIATLDADCTVSPRWIYTMVQTLQHQHADMVMGPVLLNYQSSIVSKLFALEQLSLTATAAASAWAGNSILCSGANLLFYKADFITYTRNYAPPVQAGDDMFFMSFLKSKKKRIDYAGIYEAAALTPAPADWKEFLNQRIRWVSKSRYYSDPAIILAALLVAITNASLVLLLLCIPFFPTAGYYITAGYLIKTCIDFPLLYMAARRFKQKNIMPVYPPAQLFYPIFVTFVSIYGNFGKYTWKQRSSQRMGPK